MIGRPLDSGATSGFAAHSSPVAALERIRRWFTNQGWEPFAFQEETWARYLAGESGMMHAATGTGKTYAAWMGPLAEALAERGASAAGGAATAPRP